MARVCSLFFPRKVLGRRMAQGLLWTNMWPLMIVGITTAETATNGGVAKIVPLHSERA